MKRVTYQKELNASPSMLALGSNVAIPGNLLRDPGETLSNPELEELVKLLEKTNNQKPIPTGKPKETPVPDPPASVSHVYHRLSGSANLTY